MQRLPGTSTIRVRRIGRVGKALAALVTAFAIAACVSEDPGTETALPSCESYCAEIAKNCGGDNAQYRSQSECLGACAMLDLGGPNDGDVNTVGCRLRKVRSATTLADCNAAGPFGGGVCGARCSSFCQMVGKHCTTVARPPFNSEATCNEACTNFKFVPEAGEGPFGASGGDTLNCRTHHMILSLTDREVHCPHTGVVSATCN